MIGGLKKTSLYLLAGASALSMLAVAAPAANAEYITRDEFEAYKESQPKVEWKGAPKIKSRDGAYSFKVRGRLMGDYNGIDQDFPITGADDVSAVELRRARLGVEGTILYDFKYKFEVDFAGDSSEIKDAYIAYTNWADWEKNEIIIGNFKTANSLEQLTSSRFITFMERAAFIEAFNLDRAIGGGVWAGNDHWSFQTGFYGAESGDQEGFWTDPTTFSIRGTVAPINNDTTVVHLGGSYRTRDAGTTRGAGVADLFRYRARAGDLHLADRFLATPRIGDSDDMFVLEGAFVWNRFSVQGEYAQLEVDIPNSISAVPYASPTYEGWYIEGSIFLTDDMRNYEADEGAFGRVKPRNPFFRDGGGFRGWGAWQIAGRYDVLDLGSQAGRINASTAPGAVTCSACGEQETWLIGLNWWMTAHAALKFNVTQSEISGRYNVNDGAEINGFGMRAQIDW